MQAVRLRYGELWGGSIAHEWRVILEAGTIDTARPQSVKNDAHATWAFNWKADEFG